MLQRLGRACAIIFVACCQSHLNRQHESFLAPGSHEHRHRQQAAVQDRAGVSERRTLIRMLRVLVLIFDLSRVSASLGLDESLGWPSLPTQIVPLAFVIARRFVLRLRLIQTFSNDSECVSLCRPGVESSGWGCGCGRKRCRSCFLAHRPSLAPSIYWKWPAETFRCCFSRVLVWWTLCSSSSLYLLHKSCPGREILCSDGGIDWIQKGNTFMIHGTLGLSCCANTAPAHFEVLVIIPQHLYPDAGPLFKWVEQCNKYYFHRIWNFTHTQVSGLLFCFVLIPYHWVRALHQCVLLLSNPCATSIVL